MHSLSSQEMSARFILTTFVLVVSLIDAIGLDLTQAVLVTPPNLPASEKKAVTVLLEEVEKRSQIRWASVTEWPATPAKTAIVLGSAGVLKGWAPNVGDQLTHDAAARAEGYHIRIRKGPAPPSVLVIGNDARGVLFAVGRLLRSLHMTPGRVTLDDNFDVATAPKYPMRGHQLGYRPKTHSYDAWDLKTWDQYIRDLAVFGCNAIELVAPRTDDDESSPLFPLPPMEMMKGMSKLLDDYGLDVWIWYPAMDKDYSDSRTVEFALKEWSDVFRQLPRIDAVFVPGGDPGHTQPKYLMALLEKQTTNLHKWHPKAQMWVSPQSFSQEWLQEVFPIFKPQKPERFTGNVFGPTGRVKLPGLRSQNHAK